MGITHSSLARERSSPIMAMRSWRLISLSAHTWWQMKAENGGCAVTVNPIVDSRYASKADFARKPDCAADLFVVDQPRGSNRRSIPPMDLPGILTDHVADKHPGFQLLIPAGWLVIACPLAAMVLTGRLSSSSLLASALQLDS